MIDNFVADPEALVADAVCATVTVQEPSTFQGIRAEAPPAYQQLLLTRLRGALLDCLGMPEGALTLSMCHYSLVTTPAKELEPPQRIPHVVHSRNPDWRRFAICSRGISAALRSTATPNRVRNPRRRRQRVPRALDEDHVGPAAHGPGIHQGRAHSVRADRKQDGV